MLNKFSKEILEKLRSRDQKLAMAESCTGGSILKVFTDLPGSSAVLWGGIVAYSNEAKVSLLDVAPMLLEKDGAVSAGVAKAMAWGMKVISGADWSIAVTGIAGPDGGSPLQKVGTVWIAWCNPERQIEAQKFVFDGDRSGVREQAVKESLNGLLSRLDRI